MRLIRLFATLLFAPVGLIAQTPAARNDSLLASIDRFLAAPDTNRALARALVDSAQARADVQIDLRSQFLPWLCGSQKQTPERQTFGGLLLTAFIAGNMRQQLITGKSRDESGAGLAAVLGVYRKIHGQQAAFSDPTLDKWLIADSLGRVPALADSLSRAESTRC